MFQYYFNVHWQKPFGFYFYVCSTFWSETTFSDIGGAQPFYTGAWQHFIVVSLTFRMVKMWINHTITWFTFHYMPWKSSLMVRTKSQTPVFHNPPSHKSGWQGSDRRANPFHIAQDPCASSIFISKYWHRLSSRHFTRLQARSTQ